jgi:hypothetical protein
MGREADQIREGAEGRYQEEMGRAQRVERREEERDQAEERLEEAKREEE